MQNLNNDTTQLAAIQATVNNLLVEAKRNVPNPATPPTITSINANNSGGQIFAGNSTTAVVVFSKVTGDTVYLAPGSTAPTAGNRTYTLEGNSGIVRIEGSETAFPMQALTASGTSAITITAYPRIS